MSVVAVAALQAAVSGLKARTSCAGFRALRIHENRLSSIWLDTQSKAAHTVLHAISRRLDDLARNGCDSSLRVSYEARGMKYNAAQDRWVYPSA